MNSSLKVLWVGGLLALTSFITKPATAQEWNKRTEFTFSTPVEIPGNVLTPGKYVFEIATSESNRNTVLVYSRIRTGRNA
jgi:hypothetical protein